MFTTALNDLMYHLRPARPGQLIDRAAFGEADGQSVSDWQRAAEKALNRPFPTAMVSDGLSGDGAFPAAREERRRAAFRAASVRLRRGVRPLSAPNGRSGLGNLRRSQLARTR